MKIMAHQPQFFPWSGFWAKYMLSDKIVLMPNVQWDKGQTSNRVRIYGQWLTLPVYVPDSKRLDEVRFDERGLKKVIATLEQKLMGRKVLYGSRLEPVRDALKSYEGDSLVGLNTEMIKVVARVLGLEGRTLVTDPDPLIGETKTERLHQFLLRNLGESLGPAEYISGAGGRNYLEDMPGLPTVYCEGTWEDCSVLQLIATDADPLTTIRTGIRKANDE